MFIQQGKIIFVFSRECNLTTGSFLFVHSSQWTNFQSVNSLVLLAKDATDAPDVKDMYVGVHLCSAQPLTQNLPTARLLSSTNLAYHLFPSYLCSFVKQIYKEPENVLSFCWCWNDQGLLWTWFHFLSPRTNHRLCETWMMHWYGSHSCKICPFLLLICCLVYFSGWAWP